MPGPGATGPPADLVGYFTRHAGAYDRQLWLERPALVAAASIAGPLDGARIVDVAAGTGAMARALLDRGRRPASLTLVDAAPAMLARALDRVAHAPCPLGLVEGDARALPLADDSADLVTMGFLLHLLDAAERAAVLAEARRVLAPGGRLVAVAHASPRGVAGLAHRALWRAIRAGGGDVVGGGPMADLAEAVGAGGLRVEAVRRIPGVYWCQAVRAR